MSVEVSVQIMVADGDARLVNVARVDTVLPVRAPTTAGVDSEDADLVDLARAALGTLTAEAHDQADQRLQALRGLIDQQTT
jgi:hypothetical protein